MRTSDEDWDRLGSVEPYFAVLTDERYLSRNLTPEGLAGFFASGERDVQWFLTILNEDRGSPVVLRRVLEFGCGVGRLSLPFARRGIDVVGVDAAPSMLALARAAAAEQSLPNARFLDVSALKDLQPRSFDLVFSYIVFQHVPLRAGEAYVRQLLQLTATNGTLLLHFTFERQGSILRKALRELRARSRTVHRLAAWLRGEKDLPYMQMNEYSPSRLITLFENERFTVRRTVPTSHGGIAGALLVAVGPDAA